MSSDSKHKVILTYSGTRYQGYYIHVDKASYVSEPTESVAGLLKKDMNSFFRHHGFTHLGDIGHESLTIHERSLNRRNGVVYICSGCCDHKSKSQSSGAFDAGFSAGYSQTTPPDYINGVLWHYMQEKKVWTPAIRDDDGDDDGDDDVEIENYGTDGIDDGSVKLQISGGLYGGYSVLIGGEKYINSSSDDLTAYVKRSISTLLESKGMVALSREVLRASLTITFRPPLNTTTVVVLTGTDGCEEVYQCKRSYLNGFREGIAVAIDDQQ